MSSSESNMDCEPPSTSQSDDPPSSIVLVDCMPSTSWQNVAGPSGASGRAQPPLQTPSQTSPPPPPPPPPPPSSPPPENPNAVDSDASSEELYDWDHASFAETIEFYKFKRNIFQLKAAYTTIRETTAIEFLNIRFIENNFRSTGLNKKFDKNNLTEAQIEFFSFENWFVRKNVYVAASGYMKSLRLPLFCHLYLCLYSDHNRQRLHLLLEKFKHLFISAKGIVLLAELKSVREKQPLPNRIRIFRKSKFVYQISSAFFVHLCNFFKYHYMLKTVFQEWFDVYFTVGNNPMVVYEDYYNRTISKINNAIKANAPKLNNNEFPNVFGSNNTTLSKKKLNSSQNQKNSVDTTSSDDNVNDSQSEDNVNTSDSENIKKDDDQGPSTSKGIQTSRQKPHSSKYQSNNKKKQNPSQDKMKVLATATSESKNNKKNQPQNTKNRDKNNIDDNQQPSTSKGSQNSSDQEPNSSERQSEDNDDDDDEADDCSKTSKKKHSRSSRSERHESGVKRKRKKNKKIRSSSHKRKHESHKKRRRENTGGSNQESESTIHQEPRGRIIIRIAKPKDKSTYYIKKDKKDPETEEESSSSEEDNDDDEEDEEKKEEEDEEEQNDKDTNDEKEEKDVNDENEDKDVNDEKEDKDVNDEKEDKEKQPKETKKEEEKKEERQEKDEVKDQQEKKSRDESIGGKELVESDYSMSISSSCSSEISSDEDSSEYYSSDSSFYDEEAALRKYVRLRNKNSDQNLLYKTSLFLKTEHITKIDLQNLEEDPYLCTTRQIVLKNCNHIACTLLTSDHRHVAAGSLDSTIYVWERSNVVTTLQQSFDVLNNIDSRMNKNLSFLPSEYSMNLVEILDKKKAFPLRGHGGAIYDLAETTKPKILLSASHDKTFRAWDLETKLCLEVFNAYEQRAWCIAACPYTLLVATGSCDGASCLWFLNYKRPLRVLSGHLDDVLVLKFHPNQALLASGSSDKSVRIYELVTGECQRLLIGHKGYISCLEFHPVKPNILASASGCGGEVILWNIFSGKMLWKLQVGNESISNLSWSATNILLASLTTGIVLKCDTTENYVNSPIKVKGFSTSFKRLMNLSILDSLVYTIGVSGISKFQTQLKKKQVKRVSKQTENEKDLRAQRETSPLSKLFFTKHIIENNGSPLKPLRSLDSALLNNATCDFLKMKLPQSSINLTADDDFKLNAENQSENIGLESKSAEKLISTVQNTSVTPIEKDVQMANHSITQKEVQSTDVQLSLQSQQNVQPPIKMIPQLMNDVHVSLQTNVQQLELDLNDMDLEFILQSELHNTQDPIVQETCMDIPDQEPRTERLTDDLINSMLVPLTEQQLLPLGDEIYNSNDQQQQQSECKLPSPVNPQQQDQQFQPVVESNTNSTNSMVQQLQPNKSTVEQADKPGINIPFQMLNQQANVQLPAVNVPYQQVANVQSPSINVSQRKIIVQTTTAMPPTNVQSPSVNTSKSLNIVQTTNTIPQQPQANVLSSSVNNFPQQSSVNNFPQQSSVNNFPQQSSVNNFPQQFANVPRRRIDPTSFPNVQAALLALSRPINSGKKLATLQTENSTNSGQNK